MEINDLIRLLRKHLVLLLITPVLMAGLVIFLTKNSTSKYESGTTLYTGIASGSSVEMDKIFNYNASNTAFDNLISVINSRETQQEVGIRLLTQHLMLDKCDPRYISCNFFEQLQDITPDYIRDLVLKVPHQSVHSISGKEEKDTVTTFSFSSFDAKRNDAKSLYPDMIDPSQFEQNVRKLTYLYNSNDTNFVYKLLNFIHPHYSIEAISSVNVQRITNSDLIELRYQSDDPGISQQTLLFLSEVSIRNYKKIKENSSGAVIKYFEFQLKQAAEKLKNGEDKLLQFNKDNNIINFYEQSKIIAGVKEQLDTEYNNNRIKLAGLYAAIKKLEEKLSNQQQVQLNNSKIIEKRNQLGEISLKITSIETYGSIDNKASKKLSELKLQSEKLKDEIRQDVGNLYTNSNSTNGLPLSTILTSWINDVIEAENIKAGLSVMAAQIKDFQKRYEIYAPAGANLKRIEREISVSEAEFLEILHGLNLAKLKMQDNELASNIKPVDTPYFPLNPMPTKRKLLIVAAAMFGFLMVLASIFALEFFDNTLKNPFKASRILKLPFLALFPKILLPTKKNNFPYINNRLLELALQNIQLHLNNGKSVSPTKTVLFFSTLNGEGKTVIAGNLAQKLKRQGKKVLYLNFSRESLLKSEVSQMGYSETPVQPVAPQSVNKAKRFSVINWLLGYPDNRIDYDSPFLGNTEKYLSKDELLYYQINDQFFSARTYSEILDQNNFRLSNVPDYVFIEIPAALYYPYPVGLISDSDISLLICRSNRAWSTADQGVLDVFLNLTGQKIHFILNGVELPGIASILGDLPKPESKLPGI